MSTGRLYGVGLGPGDPELITRKAARLIGEADVIAYHSGTHGRSIARSIAAELIPDGALEEPLVYPVTTGTTDHPGGYDGAIADFYDDCAGRLAAHLDAGRIVVVLCEGDPLFYGSYMYLHDRLSEQYAAEVVPGVTSFSAAAAAAAEPLVRRTDVLTILPGTLPEPELARRLADTDGAVIMKLGRTFPSLFPPTMKLCVFRLFSNGWIVTSRCEASPMRSLWWTAAAGTKRPRWSQCCRAGWLTSH